MRDLPTKVKLSSPRLVQVPGNVHVDGVQACRLLFQFNMSQGVKGAWRIWGLGVFKSYKVEPYIVSAEFANTEDGPYEKDNPR